MPVSTLGESVALLMRNEVSSSLTLAAK